MLPELISTNLKRNARGGTSGTGGTGGRSVKLQIDSHFCGCGAAPDRSTLNLNCPTVLLP